MSRIIGLMFICFISSNAKTQKGHYNAEQQISDSVDRYVQKVMAQRHIPGLALAVVRNGIPIKVKGYGFSNVEHNVRVKPETIFQAGSIGKQFTATAILQLKEDGKLNLDDRISKYLPGTRLYWQKINIRHLLTHTSGIPDIPEDSTGINLQKNYSEDDLLRIAAKLPLKFQPGQKWDYSNTGYILLGIIIHKVTGRFYGDIIKARIFDPLSMQTARVINEPDIIMNRAAGYEYKNGKLMNQSWVSPTLNTTADGSIYLTVLDLIKWDEAITQEKIMNHKLLQEMVTPVKLNNASLHAYGFGWFLKPVNGHRSYQHSGSWQGFNSYIARFPDDKLTIIVLTNLNPSAPGLITKNIAGIYIPELGK